MSNPQHEPTMEEILASIRKIISEDQPEGAADAPPPEPASADPIPFEPAPQPVAQNDVLELTQEVDAPTFEPPPAPQPAPEPQYHAPEHEVVFQAPEPAPASDIFSDTTRKAVDDVFASIPQEDEPPVPPAPVAAPLAPVDAATVETVFERAVRESFEPVLKSYLADNSPAIVERMKPLIREWMDEHFPALLEGAVRAEVERVVKARGAKR